MKTFVLALTLFTADGSTTRMPVEMWRFTSMAECTKSSLFMNKGKVATSTRYSCVESDPSMNIAKTVPQTPIAKRNS